MKRSLCIVLFMVIYVNANSQQLRGKVGDNPTEIKPSAVLELESTTRGFLPPRMTLAQRNAIVSPNAGLMIWCTDCGPRGEAQIYNGTKWTLFCGSFSVTFYDNKFKFPYMNFIISKSIISDNLLAYAND